MSFRPPNLPPKTQQEEAAHKRLVDENRKEWLERNREREREQELRRREEERAE
jgi:hypothetical protein